MSAEIIAMLARIEGKLDRLLSAPTGARPHNDPAVRKDPKGWDGPSFEGRAMSECPPDYLEKLAGLFDWMAAKDDEAGAKGETNAKGYPKSGKWKREDAQLCREWAAYARTKKAAPQQADDSDAIPF